MNSVLLFVIFGIVAFTSDVICERSKTAARFFDRIGNWLAGVPEPQTMRAPSNVRKLPR